MIIDFHTHIYPEHVAAKVLPAAKRKLKVEVPGTGAPDDLRSRMHASNITKSVILPLAKGREDVSSLNDWILSVSGGVGLIPFGAVHPFMPDLEEELDRLVAAGVRGVKMMPLLQEVFPDDSRCERLYEAVIARDMFLVTHAGRDPLEREEIYGTPQRFARTVQSFPDLKVDLAHLGGLRMWDDVQKYLLSKDILSAGKNVFFDTAYVSFYMAEKEIADLIEEIGPDRILFGSDYPWEEPGRAAGIIKRLDLSSQEKDAILWKNAAKILNL
ncbi:MAG: amidohydrolase [Methanothrix sp.]|nr:MAG: amidohydrolase [Methanothrix sp.]